MKRASRFIAVLLAVLALAGVAAAPARADTVSCHGKFINPITDVCWSCLFPLSIGGLSIWKGSRPDPKNPSFPLCACGSPIPRIGISVGFWEPVRLVDVTNKSWCFPNLGGIRLNPGFDIGHGHVQGRSQIGGKTQNSSQWQSQYYVYPLHYWMEILTDFLCFEQTTFDVAYVTEIDPLWQDSALTSIINPEVALFANPIAKARLNTLSRGLSKRDIASYFCLNTISKVKATHFSGMTSYLLAIRGAPISPHMPNWPISLASKLCPFSWQMHGFIT